MGKPTKPYFRMKEPLLFNLLPYKPEATGLSRYTERLLTGWTAATGEPTPIQLRLTKTGLATLTREEQMPQSQSSKLMRWCQERAIVQHFVQTKKLIEQVSPSLVYSPFTDRLNTTKQYRQVITCHDLTPLHFPNSRKAYLYARYWQPLHFKKSSHIIAISKSVANQLINSGISGSKITIVPNGIEEVHNPTFTPITNNFLMLARHARNKNIQLALEGFATFLRMNRSWKGKLIIVGSIGSCTKDLHRLSLELDLSDKVSWRAQLSEQGLDHLIRKSFCLISSSLMEGFDYPLLEAQARGIPTLASSIPVHQELHQNTSLFFELGDSGKSLGLQLSRLVTEQKLWEELSLAGVAHAKSYSLKRQITSIKNILEELLE